jgi:hypothetical protein
VSVGFQVDPKVTSPGGGWTVGNAYNLSSMTAYKLQSTSPLRGKGLTISSPTYAWLSTSGTIDIGAGALR